MLPIGPYLPPAYYVDPIKDTHGLFKLPPEVQILIFKYLAPQDLFTFLFKGSLHWSARDALYQGTVQAMASSTNDDNRYGGVFGLLSLHPNTERTVRKAKDLHLGLPADRSSWSSWMVWTRVVDLVLARYTHWENIKLDVHRCGDLSNGLWSPMQTGAAPQNVIFPNLQSITLRRAPGEGSSTTFSPSLLQLRSAHALNVKIVGILPNISAPLHLHSTRSLNISGVPWNSNGSMPGLREVLHDLNLHGLQELSISLIHPHEDRQASEFRHLLTSLRPHGERTLAKLSITNTFCESTHLWHPFTPFTALKEVELPASHMFYFWHIVESSTIQTVTFTFNHFSELQEMWRVANDLRRMRAWQSTQKIMNIIIRASVNEQGPGRIVLRHGVKWFRHALGQIARDAGLQFEDCWNRQLWRGFLFLGPLTFDLSQLREVVG